MKKVLLYLWQLPQNLLGKFILSMNQSIIYADDIYYVEKGVFNAGVSLGDYIILDTKYYYFHEAYHSKTVINHEKGHQKQSLYLGWFYLLGVGIPSLFNNIIDRLFHKSWSYEKRSQWYYSRYPEKWADKLGGVIR